LLTLQQIQKKEQATSSAQVNQRNNRTTNVRIAYMRPYVTSFHSKHERTLTQDT